MSRQLQQLLSPARRQRYLRRAKATCNNDPFFALDNIHKLLDGGVETAEVFHLQSTLLLQLGCGTFAAQAAQSAIKAGGDRVTLLPLLLKCHLTAYHRKPAARTIESILELAQLPENVKSDVAHGAHEIHHYRLAEQLYQELLDEDPSNAKHLINLGYAFQKQGKMQEAIDYYLQAIDHKPDSANAYKLLSSVRKQTVDQNYLDLISNALPQFEPGSEEFVTAAYALAKTFEDLKYYENAFEHFKAGADAMRPKSPYSTDSVKRAFQITKSYFEHPRQRQLHKETEATGHGSVTGGSDDPRPLFILGMPRTGSTLVDRILSSHPEVVSMGELGCFKESMKVLTGYGGGDGFHEHFYRQPEREVDLNRLGVLYVSAAGPEKFAGRYFIDKYPMNFMDLGLIARAMPNARFVHTIRNPMDTCFSNYKQLFTLGFYHYSYSMEECAEYYLLYKDIMEFWRDLLPGRILNVHYEDLVENTDTQVRRLLQFVDLDWHDDCLNFYKNESPVDTASLSQVRQPIYKSAMRHWKNYGPLLDDARNVFAAAGIDVEDDGVRGDAPRSGTNA